MAVILPVIAIPVDHQRVEPAHRPHVVHLVLHRGWIICAKLTVALGVGVASMLLAFGIGALGNLLGAAIVGVDPVWDITGGGFAGLILFQILNMLIGFMLGAVPQLRRRAIVGTSSTACPRHDHQLASTQTGSVGTAPGRLQLHPGRADRRTSMTGENWLQLAVTGFLLAGAAARDRPGRGLPPEVK